VARSAHQGLEPRHRLERPGTLDEGLEAEHEEVGRPDGDRGDQDQPHGPAGGHEQRRDRDPDEARESGDPEPDEQRVEPRDPVLGDPGDGVGVYGL
jgi:hypothetical protein